MSVDDAEAALEAGALAMAVVLFGRVLAQPDGSDETVQRAYFGLARAHERLGDCAAAIRAYEAFLGQFDRGQPRVVALARKGACEAEIGQWERSASSFAAIAATSGQMPSVVVEAYARQGYALFNLDRFVEAHEVLSEAEDVYQRALQQETERFASHYFVAMARFYRAAIIHRRFRETKIELPERAMEVAFKKKMKLLTEAQDAYNDVIRAKHMFWVSAAGYQLGHLFAEFYDDLMYAPVPEWLDERQREIYYRELKKQLRPVFDKAVWVFEKNLETARRFGYDSPFIEQTQAKLAHMQAVLTSEDPHLGRPHSRLSPGLGDAREAPPPLAPQTQPLAAVFVPPMTAL